MSSAIVLFHTEGPRGGGVERLSGAQHGRWKRRLVGRVREVLRFKRQASVLDVLDATCPGERSIEEVAGVELYARLGGADGECAAGDWVVDHGGEVQRSGRSIQDEVLIVSAGELQLLIGLTDV